MYCNKQLQLQEINECKNNLWMVSVLSPTNRLPFTKQRCFSSCVCLVQRILSFHWWKDIQHFRDEITFQMASDSPSIFPVLSRTHPPSFPLSTFTRPCECSIYCNCIQHLALQTADKPAQGQPPTLAMFINRLFVQAYQSPYPPSLCGCLWTLCSLYQNRSPLLLYEGGIGPSYSEKE